MYSKSGMKKSTENSSIERLQAALDTADAVLIGAGAGLSTSAGLVYCGERFERYFSDFYQKYGISDMYSGGFYPFATLEEYWAWWSRHIFYNRYVDAPLPVYQELLALVKDKDYFVLTTNVDHQFQRSGFDKSRLFYTQGDYGLWQCSKACHYKTYDNETEVRQMVARQRDMKIPSQLIPCCPVCGAPMTMNLRCDDSFVQDRGWYAAQSLYGNFLEGHKRGKVLYLELGVRQMVARQRDMKIPSQLIPCCPVCGAPMTMNLRCDDSFVQDRGWYAAQSLYGNFLEGHKRGKVLYLELGVGNNTPGIIKYPFWRYTLENPDAVYACLNLGQAYAPREIADRSVCLNMDIGQALTAIHQ